MFSPALAVMPDPVFMNPFQNSSVGAQYYGAFPSNIPSAGAWPQANRAIFYPFTLSAPYNLARFYWLNGTAGTDSIQVAIYNVDGGGAVDCCVAASARVLSAGSNVNQFTTVAVVAYGITSGTNTTDATSFATASVTLKARPGVMYAMSVVNTHGSSANTVTVATTGGAVSFTSRATLNFNGTLSRVSLFTAVPTSDVTDTITITIGSAQTATACLWSLVAFTNVDTATNHGIVQTATGTGNSTTPLATLSAFGSTNNATLGAHGTAQTAATPGTGFIEVHDVTASTPTCGLEVEYSSANDTTVDATITSAQWGSIAAEVKSLGTTIVLPKGPYLFGFHMTGITAQVFRTTGQAGLQAGGGTLQASLTAGLPFVPTLAAASTTTDAFPLAGFTRRASP
jgi:hypothetical protein